MSFFRNFPVPSERMGIIWSLLNVKNGIVLEYGPAGTTHFSMNFFSKIGNDVRGRLFTTDMDEKDVVMGDTNKIEQALMELDVIYAPDVIFVVASTVSSVIGIDILGVCDSIRSRIKAKIVVIDNISLSRDYYIGMEKAYCKIIELIDCEKNNKLIKTYNIIGASNYRYRNQSDIWEIQNMLKEAFGYRMLSCLSMDMTKENINNLSNAEVNIVLSSAGLKAAEILESKFNVPYIYLLPYGYKNSLVFLKEFQKATNSSINKSIVERLERKIHKQNMIQPFLMNTHKANKALVKADYDTVRGISAFLQENGIDVLYCVCDHKINHNINNIGFINISDEQQYSNILNEIHDSLVMGDKYTLINCADSNIKLCIANPSMHKKCFAEHLPLMGEKGADYLMEYIGDYLNR